MYPNYPSYPNSSDGYNQGNPQQIGFNVNPSGGYPPPGGPAYPMGGPPQPPYGTAPFGDPGMGAGYPPQQPPYGGAPQGAGYPDIGGGYPGGPQPGGGQGYPQGYPQGGSQGYPQGGGHGYPKGGGQGYPQGAGQGYPQGGGQYQPGMGGGYQAGMGGGYQAGAPPGGQYQPGMGGGQYQAGAHGGGQYQPHQPVSASNQFQSNKQWENIGAAGEQYRGTIRPAPNFNAEQDCNVLRKAMKGLGTDEKAIIECLGRRSYDQRQEIKKLFKTMFGKDLIEELKGELSSNFSRAVVESLYDCAYYDSYSLHRAMEGAGTRENVLTEILTSRSNAQIEAIKNDYKKWYNKVLEKEVVSETSGFYKRVLVSCLQANKRELTPDQMNILRSQGPQAIVDMNLANQEAQELYNAGEKKLGTDEACFIKIFALRNRYQLKATFDAYQRVSGRDILTSIEREMSGDLASALKALALLAINPPSYFATRLHKAMKGAGTNDGDLIRIILTRSEIDLENIKMEFQKMFGKTLASYVQDDTSGDYKKFLMRFVEGN